MTAANWFGLNRSRRATLLAAIIVVQALCCLYFISDIIADWDELTTSGGYHLILETIATIALAAGVIVLVIELRLLLARMAAMDTSLRASQGDMAIVIENFFERWKLTPSERDVALLVLKGFDNETIAELRGTAQGTVRAQCTKIYAKAGVDGRAQLLSIFMEELLDGGVQPDRLDRDLPPEPAHATADTIAQPVSRAPARP